AEFELAEHHLRQALADAQQLHNPYLEGHARNNLGVLAIRRGDLAGARMHYEASLTIFESVADPRARALLTGNLAEIDYKQGDLPSALNRCRLALREWRQLADHWGESATLIVQGVTFLACSRYGEALDALLTSLQLARAIPYPRTIALALDGVGRVQMEHGMYAQASALFTEAAGHAANAGERHLQCYARLGYCQSLVASGDLAAVTPVLEKVCDLAGDIDDRHLQNELRSTQALLCQAQGNLPAARAYLDQALAEETGRTYAIHRLDLLLGLATVELESASPRAGQLLREAWAAAQQFGMPRRLAQAALRLAALAAKEEDRPAAVEWFQRAETTRAQTGFVWQPWEQTTAATLSRWSEPQSND
ncbi:MAG: hypothetical protein H3C34_16620, partial [Caldilineaceae bacterium]|nr:hypothetical protein [Caldilineaceae bacterium]